MKSLNTLLALVVFALGATQLSCSVNDYCLNCATGDGGMGSGSDDALDASDIDAPPDAGCVPTGSEICDGVDNDCNGLADDGVLPQVDDPCPNQMGACQGGTKICTAGQIKCTKNASPETCDFIDNNCNGVVDEGDPSGGGKCGTEQGECIAGTLHCQSAAACNPATTCDATVPGNTCCVKCTGFVDHRLDAEVCNAKDDNCNGQFDENITLGACTWNGATNNGECNIGTLSCVGGNPQCMGAIFPKFEICNGLDDNCNSAVDEIFDKATDPTNCGSCGNVCPVRSKTCVGGANASMACTSDTDCPTSTCAVNSQPCCGAGCAPSKPSQTSGTCNFECNVGFIDLNGSVADGCEYKCSPTGTEECDGIDNNCNGMIDEGLTAPVGLCLTNGVCAGTTATCMNAMGWKCNYPSTAEFPEVSCDNLNNDCDGNIDESHPQKFQTCYDNEPASPPDQGVCRDQGVFQCNSAAPTGPLVCQGGENGTNCTNATDDNGDGRVNDGCPQVGNAAETGTQCTNAIDDDSDGVINDGCPASTLPNTLPTTETCNAKDDDCDGKFDEATGGVLAGQDWVSLGNGKQMMKYEASKPDATATDPGVTTTITNGGVTTTQVCSKQGVQPWTNISYPAAQAACAAIGASLCTESQWHQACSVVVPTTQNPFGSYATSTTASTIIEAEDYTGIGYANAPAEVACANAIDDDSDGRVNDGCPAVGAAEIACTDSIDSDGDGTVNDGCPAFGTAARSWVPDYTAGFSGIAAMEATPNTFGGGVTLGNELTQSPRLDYLLNVTTAGTYHVQLKMYQTGVAGNNDVAFVGMTPASATRTTVTLPPTITCTADATCSAAAGYTGGKCVDGDFSNNCVGGTNAGTACATSASCTGGGTCTGLFDHCSGWRWVDAAATFTAAVNTAQTVSVYMGDDGVKVDKIAITQTATAPADAALGKGNIWAYGNPPDPNTPSPMTCNDHDLTVANDNVLATGSLTSCFAKNTAGNIFDLSGNVKEWTFAQQPGQNAVRGGASNSTEAGIACALNFTVADDTFVFPNIGFRCCK